MDQSTRYILQIILTNNSYRYEFHFSFILQTTYYRLQTIDYRQFFFHIFLTDFMDNFSSPQSMYNVQDTTIFLISLFGVISSILNIPIFKHIHSTILVYAKWDPHINRIIFFTNFSPIFHHISIFLFSFLLKKTC